MFSNLVRLEVIASCTLTNSGRRANTRVRCSRGKMPTISHSIWTTWLLIRRIITKKFMCTVCDAHLNSWQCQWCVIEDHHVIDKLTPELSVIVIKWGITAFLSPLSLMQTRVLLAALLLLLSLAYAPHLPFVRVPHGNGICIASSVNCWLHEDQRNTLLKKLWKNLPLRL